jgi:flagellar hook-associated protein 2
MSAQSVTTTGLTSTNGLLQQTGLATGLNTNAIIQAELSVYQLPVSNLQAEIAGLKTGNNQLTAIQSALTTVSLDAQALSDPGLFAPVQNVTSSSSNLVSATSTTGVGGVIGSTVVEVTSLAGAAQETFNFASPTSDDTLTYGNGNTLAVPAGTTLTGLVSMINSDSNSDVWAAATSGGQLILSTRATGATTSVGVSTAGSTLAAVAGSAKNGQDAQYSINGVAGSSSTDTVTDAIPGVTLTLQGVTSSTQPVTITVQPPQMNAASVVKAVQQFVTDYNAVVNSLNTTVSTKPPGGSNFNPNSGSLFGDQELISLITNMRTSIYQPGSGLPAGLAALSDIGITTGAASASGFSQNSVAGNLTVDTNALTAAIQSHPDQVKAILTQFSHSFQGIVNAEAGPGGSIESRIQGTTQLENRLQDQYNTAQELFNQQEAAMQQQWAKIEGVLSNLQHQTTYLNSLSSALQANSPSSSK